MQYRVQALAAWHKACWHHKVRLPVCTEALSAAMSAEHAAAEQLRAAMGAGQDDARAALKQGCKRWRLEAAAAEEVLAAEAGAGEERGLGKRAAKRPRRFQQ